MERKIDPIGEAHDGWIMTFTGRSFYPLTPTIETIDIRDIAHALSNQCHWAGHCRRFISVAEHSLLVSQQLPEDLRLWGLLHDASEAYLVDLPRPLKYSSTPLGRFYLDAERRLMQLIAKRFGLDWPEPEIVKAADNMILKREWDDLMLKETPAPGQTTPVPFTTTFSLWDPLTAEFNFLVQYALLVGESRPKE